MKKLIVLCLALLATGACVMAVKGYSKEDIFSVVSSIVREKVTGEITTSEKAIRGDEKAPASEATQQGEKTEKDKKIYGVWLTYSEIGELVKGHTEAEYKQELEKLFDNLKANKINTVFYQCRAFCDSFYSSDIFPVSKYVSVDNQNLPFDPLELFIELGSANEISVHCWVNPYRVSYDKEFKNIPKDSPVRTLYKKDKNTLILCEKGIFLNPAHTESSKLVLLGIREILEKYQVSGIHFDDYFYPEANEIKDKALYEKYKSEGGVLSLGAWRRENVNSLVSSVYALVKAKSEKLVFSISPSADIEKCRNVYYADVEKWCSEQGFADYIIPQLYYGFENEEMPFQQVLEQWSAIGEKGSCKLVCGLAVYKCGRSDQFAGTGKNEWKENVNILSRQYEQTLKSPMWQGFALFSYSYCYGENVTQISKKEIKKLVCMVE